MIVKCKNCLPKEGVDVPDFTSLEKKKLIALTIQSPLHAIKYIIDNYKISLSEAKYMASHINKIYGKCNRCKFDLLDTEYINCPKCKSLNFNWEMGV